MTVEYSESARLQSAAERDRVADERDRMSDQRDRVADERERIADERELQADQRDTVADERDATSSATHTMRCAHQAPEPIAGWVKRCVGYAISATMTSGTMCHR